MKYPREQIEIHLKRADSFSPLDVYASIIRQLQAENDTLRSAKDGLFDALEEIAMAGMSGCGHESEEGMRDWHARRAWEFIGIAARAIDAARKQSNDLARKENT